MSQFCSAFVVVCAYRPPETPATTRTAGKRKHVWWRDQNNDYRIIADTAALLFIRQVCQTKQKSRHLGEPATTRAAQRPTPTPPKP